MAIFTLFNLLMCCKSQEDIVLCANRCPEASPWRVESLDLNLPCFTNQIDCRDWAVKHGYADRPCVRCN